MRVGILLEQLTASAGGAATFQGTLVAALERSPRRNEVVVFHYGELAPSLAVTDLRFARLETPRVPHGRARRVVHRASQWLAARRAVTTVGPLAAAVLGHRLELMWYPTPYFEEARVPYVYTVWDLQHRLQPYFPEVSLSGFTFEQREARHRHTCRRAAMTIVPNDAARAELCRFQGVDPGRVRPIHQPTSDFALLAPADVADPMPHETAPVLFYPAQFWPHKNHVALLEALKLLRAAHAKRFVAAFTGADKGNLAYVRRYAERLGVADQVRFLGLVPEATLVGLYRKAFALVFPSFFGPENQPPLEAFALRCPVIAAAVAGANAQLGDAALTFDPRDERALAAAVLDLEANPRLRSQLVARGRAIAEARSGDAYVARVFEIIDELAPIRRCWSSDEPYVHPGAPRPTSRCHAVKDWWGPWWP